MLGEDDEWVGLRMLAGKLHVDYLFGKLYVDCLFGNLWVRESLRMILQDDPLT